MNTLQGNIVVVGAGIVGSVQALLLARAGNRVILIDAAAPALPKTGLDVRSVALSYRSCELLRGQRMWPADAGCPIKAVHATQRGKFGAVRLRASDLDVPALGAVVQNSVLENHFTRLVEDEANIEFIRPADARLLSSTSESVSLQINSEAGTQVVDVALLVAADGTHSKLRESLAIDTESTDYEQYAIVANVQCQRDHRNVAYERFTETGPLALLPLATRQMAMVYTAKSAEVQELTDKTDTGFLALLQQRFGGKLGRFEAIGNRVSFPLALVQSSMQTSGRAVLIGNAARTVHPVAGQGLNLALRDVFELGSQVANLKADLPSVPVMLAEFAKKRSRDQRSVVWQTDLLARYFRQQPWPLSAPLELFGTTAMLLLDTVPAVRHRFAALSAGMNIPVGHFVSHRAVVPDA